MLQYSRVIKLLLSFRYYFAQYSTEEVSAISYKQQQANAHIKIIPLAILLIYINIINLCISHC